MSDDKLKKINKEIKSYINEANFVSMKFRNKLIKILGETFTVELPLDNYVSIDIILEKDGTIIMRGDKYQPKEKVSSIEELETKYNLFKEKADSMLQKKDVNFYTKKDANNILNLIIILLILIVFLFLIVVAIRSLLIGDYYNCVWLIAMSSIWIIPGLKNNLQSRTEQAKNFIKRKFKK